MKKLFIFCFLTLGIHGFSQNDENRVEGMKKEFLTKELQLSAAESDAFFPIYNEYTQKRKEARKAFRSENAEGSIDKIMDKEQELIDLKKQYSERFSKVISEKKVVQLFEAEKKFKMMVMSQLKNR